MSTSTSVLKLRPVGLFACVNEVISQLHLAEQGGYDFVIAWERSLYKDDALPGDPWTYFFEDCFPDADPNASELLAHLGQSTDSRVNIMKPRLYRNIPSGPMMLPQDREVPHRLITQYIRLKPRVREVIERYRAAHFEGYVIGLHLRGPGRLDGGTKQLKRRHRLKNGVPFELYFRHVDRQIAQRPEAKVLVCSDSQMVIEECRAKYGARVLTYASTRSNYGEMHVQNRDGRRYSGYKLGEDVIAEAYLLGSTDYFVHGNSNVSNFVLCLNPALPSTYVYEGDEHGSLALHLMDKLPLRRMKLNVKRAFKRAPALAKGARALARGSRVLAREVRVLVVGP
jgi:hypothetical protein